MQHAKKVPESVRNHFAYDAETGAIRLKSTGKKVGWISKDGYVNVKFQRAAWCAHRIAWFLQTGEQVPADHVIDHKNTVRDDNRWSNLRLADFKQNAIHRAPVARPLPPGLSATRGKFRVHIGSGSDRYLGLFDTVESASAAFQSALDARYGAEWNSSNLKAA